MGSGTSGHNAVDTISMGEILPGAARRSSVPPVSIALRIKTQIPRCAFYGHRMLVRACSMYVKAKPGAGYVITPSA